MSGLRYDRRLVLTLSQASNISRPESATDQILATLRKAGLTDLDPGTKEAQQTANEEKGAVPTVDKPQPSENGNPDLEAKQKEPVPVTSVTSNGEHPTRDNPKRSVKFADDVEERVIPPTEEVESTTRSVKKTDSSLVAGSFNSNDRVLELDDDDEIIGVTPVIPGNESPEDASLRREMLQYSLNEIGSVVAELDLEEEYSDDEDIEDLEMDDDDGSLSELSEEEDEHGRSLRKGVTSKYRQQMLELEEKLMARMIENVGPDPDEDNPEIDREDLRKLVIRDENEKISATTEKPTAPSALAKGPESGKKKGVRFADSLDVSEAPVSTSQDPTKEAILTEPAPVIGNVLERRAPSAQPPAQEAKKPGKVSRFKKSRDTDQPLQGEARANPDDQPILSDTIVEKPARSTKAPTPEAHEFDPQIQQRQLASEYYRMRNNMIRQQGGFKATDEETDQPLMEEVDGKIKKVSRFKAARLR